VIAPTVREEVEQLGIAEDDEFASARSRAILRRMARLHEARLDVNTEAGVAMLAWAAYIERDCPNQEYRVFCAAMDRMAEALAVLFALEKETP